MGDGESVARLRGPNSSEQEMRVIAVDVKLAA